MIERFNDAVDVRPKTYFSKMLLFACEETAITSMAVRKTDKVAAINIGFALRLFIIYLYFTISSIFSKYDKIKLMGGISEENCT